MRIKLGAAALTGCLLIGLFFFAPQTSRGDEWNLATKFTVSHQFEVPGMVLQADTPYVIRLLDSPSTRTVVQIYDEDQKHMLTMFMAIADERCGVKYISKERSGCPRCNCNGSGATNRNARAVNKARR